MKANELIIGKWYKFFPYENTEWEEKNEPWHIQHSGDVRNPLAHICEASGIIAGYRKYGGFDDYSEFPRGYIPSLPEEINSFLTEDKRIKNNISQPLIY